MRMKILQAVALAVILVPFGTIAVETATITCAFGSEYGGEFYEGGEFYDAFGCTNSTPESSTFFFGDYFFELTFDLEDNAPDFSVTVNTTTNVVLSHGGEGELFPGYECFELSASDGCVDFQVVTSGTSGTNWSHYSVKIDWEDWNDYDYNALTMRMLHDSSKEDGAEIAGIYDFDMCVTDGYDECIPEVNPGIRSGNTDFDSFMAVEAPNPVPEPATLLLLATGAGSTLYQRRRRA